MTGNPCVGTSLPVISTAGGILEELKMFRRLSTNDELVKSKIAFGLDLHSSAHSLLLHSMTRSMIGGKV